MYRSVEAVLHKPKTEEEARLRAGEALALDVALLFSDWLKKKGWSQRDLAQHLGKSEPYVSQLLCGNSNITLHTLADVSYVLGAHVQVEFGQIATEQHLKTALPKPGASLPSSG